MCHQSGLSESPSLVTTWPFGRRILCVAGLTTGSLRSHMPFALFTLNCSFAIRRSFWFTRSVRRIETGLVLLIAHDSSPLEESWVKGFHFAIVEDRRVS